MHCGEDRLDGDQPPEHAIPLALGSRITTYTTCAVCQPKLSQQVENKWLRDFFVQAARAQHPVVNRRTRRSRRRKQETSLLHPLDAALTRHVVHPLGHKVVIRNGRPHYPGTVVRRADGGFNIMASDKGRLDKLIADLVETTELSEAELQQLGDVDRFTPTMNDLQLSDEMAEQAMFLGVRMGAKMALSFAGEVFPEGWRRSEHAQRLRRWLWSDRPTDDEGNEIGWMPNHDLEHPFDAGGNHFVCFLHLSRADEIAVVIRVFSTLGFTVPVAPATAGRPREAWCSGPSHRGPVTTTYDELILEAMRRSPHWTEDG